jgi:hypothetical protein
MHFIVDFLKESADFSAIFESQWACSAVELPNLFKNYSIKERLGNSRHYPGDCSGIWEHFFTYFAAIVPGLIAGNAPTCSCEYACKLS